MKYTQQDPEIRAKGKETRLERYGDENYNNPEQTRITCQDKYGVDNYSQQHISTDTIQQMNNIDWLIDQHHIQNKSMVAIAETLGDVGRSTVLMHFNKHNIQVKRSSISYKEQLLAEHITEIYNTEIITNDRTIIPPKEIDIWLPEHNLAIEFNGVYWHHPERYGGEDKWFEYHQNKIDACQKQGIKLLHLWENYGDHHQLVNDAILSTVVDNQLNVVYTNIFR